MKKSLLTLFTADLAFGLADLGGGSMAFPTCRGGIYSACSAS